MRFRWFFSVLKAVSLRMTYKFQNVYDCRKNWLSLLKQSKQLLHFILLMKRWSALNILKKIIVYYDNNWFLQRKKILWKEKQKVRAAMITNGSENPINVIFLVRSILPYAYGLWIYPEYIFNVSSRKWYRDSLSYI